MATVVHILDSRTGGSLVAHIKVGETYHQRKEVSEMTQGRGGCSTVPGCPRAPGQETDSSHLTSAWLCTCAGRDSSAVVSLQ
jgi:hypothetical protein